MIRSSNPSKRVYRWSYVVCLLAFAFTLTGCGVNFKEYYFGDLFSKKTSSIDKTAEQLAIQGMQELQKKDYGKAAENFKKLKEHYPYSKYAILADLKLGDAYFYDKKYSEAAMAYEEFVRLHPRNEVVAYVLYQLGMSHFLSFSAVDRDPEETQMAMQSFEKVTLSFPNSEYARKSEKQLLECKKRIASHMYGVARHYFINDHYTAAKSRLDLLIQKYPQAVAEMGYGQDVQKMLAKCDAEVAKGEKRPGFWTRVGF
jgi:outer membrane protein assembly factor BamD